MGHPVPPVKPIEYGEGCACFPPGETPKYVIAIFSDVILCPERSWPSDKNLNTWWLLTQIPANPCLWQYLDDPWQIIWSASLVGHTKSSLIGYGRVDPTHRAYYFNSNEVADACRVNFDNALTDWHCDWSHRGYDGTGLVQV